MSESAEASHRPGDVPGDGTLPEPPEVLAFAPVVLRFAKVVPGQAARGLVPAYHFRVLVNETDVGHINLRVGDTEHVMICVGHMGFEIAPAHRGHHYALAACRALAPFARTTRDALLLTCDPDNLASRRTIELLGATFIDVSPEPPHDPHYAHGARVKCRFVGGLIGYNMNRFTSIADIGSGSVAGFGSQATFLDRQSGRHCRQSGPMNIGAFGAVFLGLCLVAGAVSLEEKRQSQFKLGDQFGDEKVISFTDAELRAKVAASGDSRLIEAMKKPLALKWQQKVDIKEGQRILCLFDPYVWINPGTNFRVLLLLTPDGEVRNWIGLDVARSFHSGTILNPAGQPNTYFITINRPQYREGGLYFEKYLIEPDGIRQLGQGFEVTKIPNQ